MPTKSTHTRINNQRKDQIDLKGPKQKKYTKWLQTHNLPTDDMENINNPNKRRDLLLANKPQIVPWGAERVLQRILRHSRVTLTDKLILNESKTRRKKSSYDLDWRQKGLWYGSVNLGNNLPQIYKILHEDINFIDKTMKTWRVELTAGGRSLADAKFQRGIFQGDALSPLLFIITLMPLNHILRKCKDGYRLSRLREKINHINYMVDVNLFAKKGKRTGNSNTRS